MSVPATVFRRSDRRTGAPAATPLAERRYALECVLSGVCRVSLPFLLALAGPLDLQGLQGLQEARWVLTVERALPESGDAPLTRVLDMAEGPAGRLYVADIHGIQVFTKTGEHVRQIGRRAATPSPGPGEFGPPGTIGFLGDTLWVADASVGRVTLFDTEGGVIDTWSGVEHLPPSEAGMPFKPLAVLSPGRIVAVELPESLDVRLYGSGGTRLIIVDPEGTPVARLPELDPTHAYMVEFEPPSTRVKRRQPFAFSDMVGADPYSGKLVVARRPVPSGSIGSYAIRAFGGDGRELFEARRAYSPTKLSDAEVDEWIDSQLSRYPSRLLPEGVRRKIYHRGIHRPGYHPPISNDLLGVFEGPFAFASDGSVWVKRTTPGDEDVALWDVFAGAGTLRGTARAPRGVLLHLVTDGRAWGVRTDELGIPQVVSFEIGTRS